MLAEEGYARLAMDRVASRAGVGKASLYRRWPTKEALVLEAIRHRVGEGRPAVSDTGSLRRDMLTYLRALIRYRQAHSAAVYSVAGEALTNPALAEAFRLQVADSMLAGLRTIVGRGVQRGELPPSADVELLACLPLALLHHLRVLLGEPVDERQAKRIVDQFFSQRTGNTGAPGGRS
jgi:AcrR family transcriptional regulator